MEDFTEGLTIKSLLEPCTCCGEPTSGIKTTHIATPPIARYEMLKLKWGIYTWTALLEDPNNLTDEEYEEVQDLGVYEIMRNTIVESVICPDCIKYYDIVE